MIRASICSGGDCALGATTRLGSQAPVCACLRFALVNFKHLRTRSERGVPNALRLSPDTQLVSFERKVAVVHALMHAYALSRTCMKDCTRRNLCCLPACLRVVPHGTMTALDCAVRDVQHARASSAASARMDDSPFCCLCYVQIGGKC